MAQELPEVNENDEIYDDLVWAREVLTVYKYQGRRMNGRKFSSSCKSLHEWSENPENKDKFLSQMVPKATDILAKNRKNDDPDAVLESEKRSISELQGILKEAIEESEHVSA
jgi:hypothetical protein